MSSILLVQDVAATKTATPTRATPVFTVEGAFRAAGYDIMPEEVMRQLKLDMERQIYFKRYQRNPVPGAIDYLGWRWYTGDYNRLTRKFKKLDRLGAEVEREADVVFAEMTERLNRELQRVPGIEYRFVVQSLYTDPIGGVLVTENGKTTPFWYNAWFGNKTTWPPRRG